MRLSPIHFSLLACAVGNLALAQPEGGPALEPGQAVYSAFPEGGSGGVGWRRHAFRGHAAEWVKFTFMYELDEDDGDVVPTVEVKVTDGSGASVEFEKSEEISQTSLAVRARLPADGTFYLHLGASLPVGYSIEQSAGKVAPILKPGESSAVEVDRGREEYLQLSVRSEDEGQSLALSLQGPHAQQLTVSLLPSMKAPPVDCEGGPCEGRDFVWPAKRGTFFLRVRAEKTASGLVGLELVPAGTRPLVLGRAVEGRLDGRAPTRTFVYRSLGADLGLTLKTTGFAPSVRLTQLKAGALGLTLPPAMLDGRVSVPLRFGLWLITVGAEGRLSSSGGAFVLEAAPPRGHSVAEMLGAPPPEPVVGNVAVVDVSRVLAESAEGKAGRERLSALKGTFESLLTDKQKALSGLKGEAFSREYAALEATERELGLKLSAENAKATALLFEKLRSTVGKLKQERGLELVVTRELVAWGAPSVDLTPAVLEAFATGQVKKGPALQKLALVDLTRVWRSSRRIDRDRDGMSRVLAAGKVEKALKERFFTAANTALQKVAQRDGLTLVLLKEGLASEFQGLRWKVDPPDLTEELLRLVDGE